MANFSDNLFTLRGRVMRARPNIDPILVRDFLNDRLRQILDSRTIWADLLTPGILSFPNPTITQYDSNNNPIDTVSLTYGSPVVSGSGTTWPVSDVTNTTIAAAITEIGYVEVTPASMAGITANSFVYVDAAGTPEIVPVIDVTATTFIGKFELTHGAGATVTQSSLANLQLKLNASYPVFTIGAVTATNSLTLTLPWGGPSISAQTYAIKLMYTMLAPDLKAIVAMKDEQSGFPVRLHVALEEADFRDPRRTLVSGNPWYSLLDLGANQQGNMVYEVWPAPSQARQFSYYYNRQWPDMVKDDDRPPPFINASILFYGALADAKRHRVAKDDPFYDPQIAQEYEVKFMMGVEDAKNADEAKCFKAMKNAWWRGMLPGGYDSFQLNDPGAAGFWTGAIF